MKKILYLVTILAFTIPIRNNAMEEDSDRLTEQAVQQRKEQNKTSNTENFGDSDTAQQMPAVLNRDIGLSVNSLDQKDRNGENKKKEKKEKKTKKDKKSKKSEVVQALENNQADSINDQLKNLEEGVREDKPEEIDAIIEQLKIFKVRMTPEKEKNLKTYLSHLRENNKEVYDFYQQRILEEAANNITRGKISEGKKTVEELQAFIRAQLACNALMEGYIRENTITNQKRAEIQAQSLSIQQESNTTQTRQLEAVQQGNANAVTAFTFNKKTAMYTATIIGLGFLLNLGVSIGGYFK